MGFWELIFLDPILNLLIVISSVLAGNFGLAIIALTIITRLIMLPLTVKQLRSSKKMNDAMKEIHPKLQQLQKKYAKDKQKLFQETQKLYKEAGMSPMGCLTSPMLITMLLQFPIFIAVYRSIMQAAALTPQDFLGLSDHIYSWSIVREALPVSDSFLWLNLGTPDSYFIIPVLVGVTMWFTQKLMPQSAADPRQQSMQGMMQLMMPIMFGFITLSMPSGIGLYFFVSTAFQLVVQYRMYGLGNLRRRKSQENQVSEKKTAKA